MKFIYLQIILLSFGVLTTANAQSVDEDIAVIVSSTISESALKKEDILSIYSLRTLNWGNGSRIMLSDYKGNSDIRNRFYSYLGTQINTIKRIWLKAQFTGKITPPQTFSSTDEMIKTILEQPGMIGYVPLSKVTENTTVLLVIPR